MTNAPLKNEIGFKPKHITNLSGVETDSLSIVSREYMQRKLNEICNVLNHPAIIINLNYESQEHLYKRARVESTVSTYEIRKSCRNFRLIAGEEHCIECDYIHALQCQDALQNKVDIYGIDKNKYLDMEYIIYHCPMLGYIELCFPIKYDDDIIGVLFLGEIWLNNKKEKIEEIQNLFLKDDNIIFRDYLIKYQEKYENAEIKVKDLVLNEGNSLNNCVPDLLDRHCLNPQITFMKGENEESLLDLIKSVYKEIRSFEKELKKIWHQKVRKNLSKTLSIIKNSFDLKFKEVSNKTDINYTDVQDIFIEAYKCIVEVRQQFSFLYCRVFENLPIVQGKLIQKSVSEIGDCPYGQLTCDFKRLNVKSFNCKNSVDDEADALFECLLNDGEPFSPNNCIVFACKNYYVLFGCHDIITGFPKALREELCEYIESISNDLDYLSSEFIRLQHERTLRMYRHDCIHLAERIEHNNRYYSSPSKYNSLTREKQQNVYNDIKSTAIQLRHLSDNIGLILGTINSTRIKMQNSYVDIRNEFNKWRAMFRLELAKKNIRLFNATRYNTFGIKVYTHEELLSLLLYNLIDNAIKYCYWGTNIRTEIINGKIIVEDFGISIDSSERIYDLYYRASNAAYHNIGDGIGLYSSKRIAEILGVKLSHTCKWVSDYHIPFVFEAKKRGIDISDYGIDYKKFTESLHFNDLSRVLIDSDYYLGYYDPEYSYVSNKQLIDYLKSYNPTYRVQFIIDGLKM